MVGREVGREDFDDGGENVNTRVRGGEGEFDVLACTVGDAPEERDCVEVGVVEVVREGMATVGEGVEEAEGNEAVGSADTVAPRDCTL